ncbi:hypothetical protein PS15m_008777 [Mucor circinelloides]
MPMDDRYVPSGWLHKSARFSLLHPLKLRYFVLLDKELRYYKHPDDTHAAGVIELKDYQDIEEHNTSDLFGFKLVSETNKGHWIPMLYAVTEQERHLWIKRIKANLNRLSNCSHYCSPHFCSLDTHHHDVRDNGSNNALHSVLDRWLNKLDLYDGSDEDSDYFPRQSSSSSHSRSNSSLGRLSSLSSTTKYTSNGSIQTLDYRNNSTYSKVNTTSNASSASSSHHTPSKRQYSTPTKRNLHQTRQHAITASDGGNYNAHPNAAAWKPPTDTTDFSPLAPSSKLTKQLSIESERLKYAETTLEYYQHPHIHRSTSTKFRFELGISLSPPPPRR